MEQYTVTGMSCAACQARVEKAVSKVEGVSSCSVSLLTNSMGVEGDASPSEIIRAVEKAGYGARLKGSSRGNAGQKGHPNAGDISEVEESLADTETLKLRNRLISSAVFLLLLMYITMGHNMWGWPLPAYFENNHTGLALAQLLLSATVMIINGRFFTNGFRSLLHGAPNMDTLVALGSSVSFGWSVYVLFGMCGIISEIIQGAAARVLSGIGSAGFMELYHNQLYFESAAMIPALITVGKLLESISKGKTTNALKGLIKLAPKSAVLITDGTETEVDIDQVVPGDIFVVKPGTGIPVDGVVIEGTSAVNEAVLTGESVPVDKEPGDKVSAATINQNGVLKCRAERVGGDTMLAQIIRMVSDTAATKAPIARIADKVSGVFVPAVIGIALLVTVCWLIAGAGVSAALERGICVLVISCPCALGLATPVAIMVGNGLGAKNGILFKTSEALENAGKIDIIAIDKTGTITSGEPVVTDIVPAAGVTDEELLKLAYSLEIHSEHPLGQAVVRRARAQGIEPFSVRDFKALTGSGLKAYVPQDVIMRMANTLHENRNESVKHGNAILNNRKDHGTKSGREMICLTGGSGKYIRSVTLVPEVLAAAESRLSGEGKTPLFFALEDRITGIIAVADTIKPDSAGAVRAFRNMGLKTVMLTGDNERTAAAVGREAGVDEVIAGVLPDGKASVIERLKSRGKVAMVGDGINDAPALTGADIGIAIGAGTDVAIDSADVVLMNSSLNDAAAAIRLSRATLRNIHQNLFWAFFYNIICIPLAAGLFGWKMNPMIGAAAMSLSSFTVCMNALRLNLFKLKDASHDRAGMRKRRRRADKTLTGDEKGDCMEKTVKIKGMMCGHCEAAVKKALEAIDGVESAVASHTEGTAVITCSKEIDEAVIRKAIEDKDYEYVSMS